MVDKKKVATTNANKNITIVPSAETLGDIDIMQELMFEQEDCENTEINNFKLEL